MLKRNLFSLYIIKVVYWFLLIMPVIVPFYYHFGLSTAQIFIIQSAYSLAMVVFEIPSGYIADRFGRKNSIILGCVLGFFGYGLYCISEGFWQFMAAEMVLCIGQSMISGADSAILYDSLLSAKQEGHYVKLEGRISSFGNFAEAIGGVCGGLLAAYAIKAPFYVQCSLAFLSIPASIALVEPKLHTVHKTSMKDVWRILRFSLIENKELQENLIFSAFIGAATLSMAWLAQPYFIKVGIPLAIFGILWTILNFSVGISSLFAFKISSKIQPRTVFWGIAVAIPLLYVLMGLFVAKWALVLLLLFYLVRGFVHPVVKDYIHGITPSEMRATVLSIRNFIIRVVFSITGPVIGYLTDKISLGYTLMLAGAFYFISCCLVLIVSRKH